MVVLPGPWSAGDVCAALGESYGGKCLDDFCFQAGSEESEILTMTQLVGALMN